eukprot:COSAG01_NODE_48_length_31904_cov_21.696997_29_plen_55_part_00
MTLSGTYAECHVNTKGALGTAEESSRCRSTISRTSVDSGREKQRLALLGIGAYM